MREQKQNSEIQSPCLLLSAPNLKKKESKGKNGSNDYIFKRFRLEQNRIFKEKHNEDVSFGGQLNPCQAQHCGNQIDDVVVINNQIVDFEDQDQDDNEDDEAVHNQVSEKNETEKMEDEDEIYIFEPEQLQEQKKEQVKTTLSNILLSPNESVLASINEESHRNLLKPPLLNSHFMKKKEDVTDANQKIDSLIKESEKFDRLTSEKDRLDEEEGDSSDSDGEIKGMKVTASKSIEDNVSLIIYDKKLLSISKLPSGIILKCLIKRSSSMMNLISPEFDLYLANGLKHIISAKKYPLRNRQLFKFSNEMGKFEVENIFATLHSNVYHNTYWLLDEPKQIEDKQLSFLHLIMCYNKVQKQMKQRKMSILIPPLNRKCHLGMKNDETNINFKMLEKEIKLRLTNLAESKFKLENSSKNFVLVDQEQDDYHYVKMNKESDHIFELELQHPMTPLQAMAIALTRFDAQLN